MASTYSNLKIQLMATGENSGTWGNVTNVNLGTAIEQAMVETATVTFSSANVTLTLTDTNAAQNARALRLNLTGTTGGARDLIVPAVQKPYIVNNGTADTITVKVSGQTGIAVPASKTMLVYNNGTDVVDAINHLSALSLGTALPISSGGTGSTSTTYANLQSNVTGTLPVANGGTSATTLTSEAVVIGNGTSAVKFVAPGTDGNVLTSNGTAWVSEAIVIPPSVPTGTIATFAGDPGAGWLECNGQIVSQSTYSDLYSKVGLLADAFQTTSVTFITDGPGQNTEPGVAFGNSTFVAGSSSNSAPNVYTSTDAITWTFRSVGWVSGVGDPTKLIYGDKFVMAFSTGGTASTNRNNIATSTDGITWTARTTQEIETIYSVAYGNSVYVITGNAGNKVQTSTDAITWTKRTLAVSTVNEHGVVYGNNIFVCVGVLGSPLSPIVQTSTDGITWTYRSNVSFNNSAFYSNYLYFTNGKFYVSGLVSNYGSVGLTYSSTDGITWSALTTLGAYVHSVKAIGYDSANSLLYAYGWSLGAYTGTQGARGRALMCVSGDDGVTWQASQMGAVFNATSTTIGFSTNNAADPFITGISYLNNKIIVNGYVWVPFNNQPTGGRGVIYTFSSPYTYQTDTQFAVPTAIGRSTGVFNSGRKSSLAAPFSVSAKDLRYYIKT